MNIEKYRRFSETSRDLARTYEEEGDYEKALYYSQKTASYMNTIFRVQHYEYLSRKIDTENSSGDNNYRKMFADMDRLSEICRAITANFDFEDMIRKLSLRLSEIIEADRISFYICDSNITENSYHINMENGLISKVQSPEPDCFMEIGYECISSKEGIILNDFTPSNADKGGSLIYMPLILRESTLGYFGIHCNQPGSYGEDDFLKLKLIADYISISLENSKYYHEKKYPAAHDYLTGMLNRRELISIGESEFIRLMKDEMKMSVIIIDADGFKAINDRFGHMAGDQVIVKISEVICDNIRNTDYAGRHGGEEFMIILSETGADIACGIAERIRTALEKSSITLEDGTIIKTTASFGVFEFDRDTASFEEGVIKADEAMYRAKQNGKNCVYIKKRNQH